MKSLIEWFANNGVVANLLMFIIIILGVMGVFNVNQEVFPEFEAQMISVSVPYRGAAPEEVEEAVSVRLEESIQGLEGVKRITSTSSEGSASVMVEVETGYDTREAESRSPARRRAIRRGSGRRRPRRRTPATTRRH